MDEIKKVKSINDVSSDLVKKYSTILTIDSGEFNFSSYMFSGGVGSINFNLKATLKDTKTNKTLWYDYCVYDGSKEALKHYSQADYLKNDAKLLKAEEQNAVKTCVNKFVKSFYKVNKKTTINKKGIN